MQRSLNPLHDTDAALWNAFRQGDKQAYLKIYDAHYNALFVYGVKVSGDKVLTNDCIQELFLELWKNRSTINSVTRIRSYLLVYLKRKLMAEKKKKLLYINKEFYDFDDLNGISHEDELIQRERTDEQEDSLQKAISNLTDRQKEILHLKFFESMSYEEIAELTGLKIGRVYNIAHETIKALRKYLVISLLLLITS